MLYHLLLLKEKGQNLAIIDEAARHVSRQDETAQKTSALDLGSGSIRVIVECTGRPMIPLRLDLETVGSR